MFPSSKHYLAFIVAVFLFGAGSAKGIDIPGGAAPKSPGAQSATTGSTTVPGVPAPGECVAQNATVKPPSVSNNQSTNPKLKLNYNVFSLSTEGTNVFHAGNHPTAVMTKPLSHRRTDDSSDDFPYDGTRGASLSYTTTQTSGTNTPASRTSCNFDGDWCGFNAYATPWQQPAESRAQVDRINGGYTSMRTRGTSVQLTLDMGGGNSTADHYDALYCNNQSDPCIVQAKITRTLPSNTGRMTFNRAQLLITENSYRPQMLVVFDGSSGNVLGYDDTGGIWQTQTVSVPSGATRVTFIVSDDVRSRHNYAHIAMVDDIVFESGGGTGQNNNSSTVSGDYMIRINQLNGIATENYPVLMTSNGESGAHLIVKMTAPLLNLVGNAQIPFANGSAIAPKDLLGTWIAFNQTQQSVARNAAGVFTGALNLSMNLPQTFAVSAGENYRYNNQNQPPLVYSLHVATDYTQPTSNLSPTVLETLGGVILPWLGAQMSFNLQDDLQLKGLKITDSAGRTEVFKTDFATNAYSYGVVANPFAGRVVLSSAEVSRVPAVAAGGYGVKTMSSLNLKLDVEDLSGRHGNWVMNSSVFDIPSDAKIICDRYNLQVGESTSCRWERLPKDYTGVLPYGLKVVFKVWKKEVEKSTSKDGFATTTVSGGVNTTFTPQECGKYDVEAVLLTASDSKFLGKRSPNVARFDIPCNPVRSVVAVGLDTKALVCPGSLPCGQNDDKVQSYDIYRRLMTTGDEYQKIKTVPRNEFLERCFVDEGVQVSKGYYYQIQGNLSQSLNAKTNKSEPDLAEVRKFQSEFKFEHVPKINDPMPFKISAGINSPQPRVSIRVFPSDTAADYRFMTANAEGVINPEPVNIGNKGLSLKTDALPTGDVGAIGWLQFTDSAYTHPGARGLEIIVGDLAEEYDKLKRDYVDIALGAMTANIEAIPIDKYLFYGNALGLKTERPCLVYDIQIPVVPENLAVALKYFYFDADSQSGLLFSSAWKQWVDANRITLFSQATSDMTNLSALNLAAPATIEPFANSLATMDIIDMVLFDAQPGNCLFKTNCTAIDFENYYGQRFGDRLIGNFFNYLATSGGSFSTADDGIIKGWLALTDYFGSSRQQAIEEISNNNPGFAAVLTNTPISVSIDPPVNSPSWGDAGQQRAVWSRVYAPALQQGSTGSDLLHNPVKKDQAQWFNTLAILQKVLLCSYQPSSNGSFVPQNPNSQCQQNILSSAQITDAIQTFATTWNKSVNVINLNNLSANQEMLAQDRLLTEGCIGCLPNATFMDKLMTSIARPDLVATHPDLDPLPEFFAEQQQIAFTDPNPGATIATLFGVVLGRSMPQIMTNLAAAALSPMIAGVAGRVLKTAGGAAMEGFSKVFYSNPAVQRIAQQLIRGEIEAATAGLQNLGLKVLTESEAAQFLSNQGAQQVGRVAGFVEAGTGVAGTPQGYIFLGAKRNATQYVFGLGQRQVALHELVHVDQLLARGVQGLYGNAAQIVTKSTIVNGQTMQFLTDPLYRGLAQSEIAAYAVQLSTAPAFVGPSSVLVYQSFFKKDH
ncbi:MAG: hypothetical protein Q7T03_04345 [Deltaproteobacteria bacterium]|nr:hypothetical protein [Deltaproteobacteria bacterium]